MKVNVSLDFKSRINEAELVKFAANVLARMKDNPKFDSIKPLIATDLQRAYDDYFRTLQEAADGSRTKISEKKALRKTLLDVLEKIAVHLQLIAADSEAVVLEAGYNLRRRGRRGEGDIGQVQNLRVQQGEHPGEVVLLYDGVPLARMYALEWKTEEQTIWNNGAYPTATRAMVDGLPQRQEVQFHVCALGSSQRKGAWSKPVRFFVQ